jgi:hypothetical protein
MNKRKTQGKGSWTCQLAPNFTQITGTCRMVTHNSAPVAVAAEGRAQVAARQCEAQQAVDGVRHGGCKLRLLCSRHGGWLRTATVITASRRYCI